MRERSSVDGFGLRPTVEVHVGAPVPSDSVGLHLINAKLQPPIPAAACVARPALLARLDASARRKVVLVAAPTGAGKSTLLTQWYRTHASSRTIAWLSLDEHDNEPVRFFSYLIAAIRRVASGFNAYIATRRTDDDAAVVAALTDVILERLEQLDTPLTIVIDDCQWLTSPPLSRALDLLIRRSPRGVRWIVCGRCIPDINIGALRVNDSLLLIGAEDLSFDAPLIQALAKKLSRRPLTREAASYIRDRTEGWVAGVKLALLAWEDARAHDDALKAFAGSHFEVANYLSGSVLQDQPDEVRQFLLASCIVDRMTAELCNALLSISDSQWMLERLERAQLFIQPLDGHRHWFRYHTLFHDFLRSRLRRDGASLMPDLHRRASHWYAEHQFYDDALKHAFESHDLTWRNSLLARCMALWLQSGDIAKVVEWSERLNTVERLHDFSIARSYVSALILSRRFDEAALLLRQLHAVHGDPEQLHALDAMHAVLSDSDDTRDIDAPAPSTDAFFSGTLLTLKAYALLRRNQFDASRRMALRARETLRNLSAYSRGYAEVVAALADRAQGDIKGASIRCEQTFDEVRSGSHGPAWVNAATPLAYVRYEENRLAEAEALCLDILPRLSIASTIESLTTAYITFARVHAAAGRFSEAQQLLDALQSALEGGAHMRFLAQVWAEKLLLHLRASELDAAARLAHECELRRRVNQVSTATSAYDEATERCGTALAHLTIAQGDPQAALDILKLFREKARDAGFVYRQIRLEAALACALSSCGHHEQALQTLNSALTLTRGFGFTRGVFDETPGLTSLIKRGCQDEALRRTLPFHYWRKFDDLFSEPHVPERRRVGPASAFPLEPLTDREIDILKLLARGLSNTEISRHSQIAISTAKWHLKNVFAKLDVSTRTGALARARELKLVD